MSLVKLPYELVAYVVRHLHLCDIRSLSFSCRKFQFLLHEPSIAKLVLEANAPYTLEARDARANKRYAAELRRLIKRREAIASVSPYLVAIVGHADAWIYVNGVLCYIRGRQIRILDLHRAARHEMVVSICKLLDVAIKEPSPNRKYRLQLLYYAHDIVSCLYSHPKHAQPGCASWLLVFNPRTGKIITTEPLRSTFKIFVRNNDKFLYYGTNSEMGRDGYRRWVIRGFDLTEGEWLDQKLDIAAVIGSDIGSTVSFEIFDGYFYGISNQTSLEIEEVDWVSYYTCFRFPLTRRGFHDIERAPRHLFWRRSQAEGPIDDRWTFLRIFKDEMTGQLKVIESRKEWLSGGISARRTYYTTVIDFDDSAIREAWDLAERQLLSEADPSASNSGKPQQGTPARTRPRDPHMVHPGDDSSSGFTFTLSKCPIRSYYPSSQTFLDIVNDTASFDPSDQRIRIRGGSRRLWTPGELWQRKCLPAVQGQEHQDTFLHKIDSLYRSEVVFWPPDRDQAAADPALADLYAVLNPPGHVGNLHGSWDERSLIYATGGASGSSKSLVFVSFDPSLYLEGAVPYPNKLVGRSDSQPSLQTTPQPRGKDTRKSTAGWHPTSQPDATHRSGARVDPDLASDAANGVNCAPWGALESASYREIARGYHFAR
ncbi:hypothetical protein MMYC01_209701 [Madurella mycetomatis]|uniref:F-box domain-containing protein n=1 Tax=Madurella mycetomatis TaxID=100816 RepID=A0A175VQS8_9PEZI|nr:hypothetical protein MMYC01_209701 [Madurella mycetomatis]